MSQSFNNNINSLNTTVTNNFTVIDDRSEILAWLSPLDPKLRHQDIRGRRVENVGEWLLQTEEFRSWYASSEGGECDKAVLFCYGDPGVGKTYISSLVIDSLCDQARGQNATIACFYFDFAAQKEQSPTSMLGALLKQLVCGLEETPEEISRAYRDQNNVIGGRAPQLSDIVKMLQSTSSIKQTFICIDALDECAAPHRAKLLSSLNEILQKSPDTRIFITGRPHVQPEIGRRLPGRVMSVSISPKKGDVIRYLHAKLDEDTTPDAMDSNLEADILKKISEDISEIFLLVSLNIDAILQETTTHRRRQKLSAIVDGLGLENAYGATVDRIRGQGGEKSRLGMTALMWISRSERPLKANELCHALAVEIGSPNLNTYNIPSIRTLLTCCQGLITVDKEASTVRLIHFTLQEYLRVHPHLFGTAHSKMAETCLSYLNSQQVKALPINPFPDLQETPFLKYSSLYWGIHAKGVPSDCAKLLALQLFSGPNHHISMRILLEAHEWCCYGLDVDRLPLFSGLHCASFFGIVEIVASLVEVEGCDINQKDCTDNTPLVWAAFNGHEGVVKILLEQDHVSPDGLGRKGGTPLSCAARRGHEGVVKILLEWGGVDPDKPDYRGKTPLFKAARGGHEGVVKILLEQDQVSPDRPDRHGQIPLGCAAWNGHEGVVKILLERDDVDPDRRGRWGQTPLCAAAQRGHEGIVKILLERDDVDPDKPNDWHRTPLSFAGEDGHEGVVKMLLERDDVDPDKPDRFGKTALSYATRRGHAGVIALLQPKPTTPSTAEDASSSLLLSNTDDLCPISARTATTP